MRFLFPQMVENRPQESCKGVKLILKVTGWLSASGGAEGTFSWMTYKRSYSTIINITAPPSRGHWADGFQTSALVPPAVRN